MRVQPYTVKQALPFVRRVHRRLPKVQGAMWSVALVEGGEVVGVALVGWPARKLNADTLCVLRVAVMEGHRNGCSMLYGSCSRAGKAMGVENMVTYTHFDESGVSLKAAGWIDGGLSAGGEWDCPSRPRLPGVDIEPKRRWWAPWSVRAKEIRSAITERSDEAKRADRHRAGSAKEERIELRGERAGDDDPAGD